MPIILIQINVNFLDVNPAVTDLVLTNQNLSGNNIGGGGGGGDPNVGLLRKFMKYFSSFYLSHFDLPESGSRSTNPL
jgi:hypothetical protein